MKTLIVTGVTSFVGCHLACFFAGEGFQVIGTVSGGKSSDSGTAAARLELMAKSGAETGTLDLTEESSIASFVGRHRPDFWIHHAGWARDYRSFSFDLARAHSVNVAPLGALYESLEKNGCRGVIITGTESEYGVSINAHREDEIPMPATPYGLSKLSETIRSFQLAHYHRLPTRVARLFIPYGPLDSPLKVIPATIRALAEKREMELSSCEQLRDFLHVDDVARGYRALVRDIEECISLFDIFNLSSGRAKSLRDVLTAIADGLSSDRSLLRFGALEQRSSEAPVCYGDTSKAEGVLKWSPAPFEDGIRKYLKQYKELGTL
ncbi:MAG: NAD(P)-dependent oxidoreductase [Candidatus Eremiobacteraeota bacterium]|nr:NAD(P)-dependent oxidoreductase [Candidatus Eremiobacteraeota bacterium]